TLRSLAGFRQRFFATLRRSAVGRRARAHISGPGRIWFGGGRGAYISPALGGNKQAASVINQRDGPMSRSIFLRILTAIISIVSVTSTASATVLFSETFTYPDGNLADHPLLPGLPAGVSGGLWTVFSGAFPVRVSSGRVTLQDNTHPNNSAPPREA